MSLLCIEETCTENKEIYFQGVAIFPQITISDHSLRGRCQILTNFSQHFLPYPTDIMHACSVEPTLLANDPVPAPPCNSRGCSLWFVMERQHVTSAIAPKLVMGVATR